jgi:peptidoglycan/xylan/chitin deacetylase (PgdA/CDA1 family)
VGSWVSGWLFSYPDCASVPVFFNLPRLNVELPNYNWTVDTYDYKTSNPQTAADNIFKGVFDESILADASDREYTHAIAIDNVKWSKPIILMHSIHAVDPEALELIILGLQKRGYGFGTLPRPGDNRGTVVPISDGS